MNVNEAHLALVCDQFQTVYTATSSRRTFNVDGRRRTLAAVETLLKAALLAGLPIREVINRQSHLDVCGFGFVVSATTPRYGGERSAQVLTFPAIPTR